MKDLPPVSVVIPALNEADYLPVLLESLARTDAPMEVLVVDGNSEDSTAARAEEFAPRFAARGSSLRVLSLRLRRVSVQRNAGARVARHEIVLLIDADTNIESAQNYCRLISSFEREGYAMAAPFMVPIGYDARAALMYLGIYVFEACACLFDRAYFNGACVLIRKDVFERMGGYNEALQVHEDIEFSDRVSRIGQCGVLPISVAVSSRRFKKYGYAKVFFGQWGRGLLLLLQGRIEKAQATVYPFGKFSI